MHKLFAEWYRVAQVDPKGDDLPKRWAGVEAVIASMDITTALEIARLFLGLRMINAETKERIALAFQAADPAFPMRDNDLELRILAGAIVAHYVETKRTHIGDALALAVVSGACPSLRQPVLIPEIVATAMNYLFDEALRVRAYTLSPQINGSIAKGDQLLADVKTSAAQNNLSATVDALGAPIQKLHSGIAGVAESANKAVSHLNGLVAALVEQTNVLWWVFAGASHDLKESFSKMALDPASLVAGKELADLIEVLPGPVAAPAVLDKILVGEGTKRRFF